MAYLQFDLDAKRQCRFIARATGIPEAVIGWGLLELWEHCWVEKQTGIEAAMLPGFFGEQSAKLVPHLISHGFLRPVDPEGVHGVRGAAKRLGIQEAQAAGGRSKLGNLRQFRAIVNPPAQPEIAP